MIERAAVYSIISRSQAIFEITYFPSQSQRGPQKSLFHDNCNQFFLFHLQVNKDASFYLCGPAGNMPAQVKEAAVNSIAKAGNMSKEAADQMVTDWMIKGKYNVEVW